MRARYTTEQAEELRRSFEAVAESYRRHGRVGLIGIAGFIFCIAGGALFLKGSRPGLAVIVPAAVCWVIGVIAIISAPQLKCPGCGGRLDRGFGDWCPECGSDRLGPAGWLTSPRCDACGKRMRRAKTRQYKIRACTHCGLMLDDRGL